MEAAESPLEVLSRAAVMLQRNVLPPSYDEARSLSQHQQLQKQQKTQRKCKPNDTSMCSASSTTYENGGSGSGKWKRERKYQHKPSASVCDSTSSDVKLNSRFSSTKCLENEAEPLDMSKRAKDRGEPPSYFQSILCSNYGRCQTGVPAVFPSSTLSDKEAMCDQVINEHFRRSLGRDYLNVFSAKSTTTDEDDRLTEDRSPKVKVETEKGTRCISPSPLSVDDHFAKALGETWIKLQQQQKQSENQNSARISRRANES